MEIPYYIAEKQEKVLCPVCGEKVYMLHDSERYYSPRFNICFNCKFIGLIGIGSVEVKEK